MRTASGLPTRSLERPERSGAGVVGIIIAELVRAIAAEQRYLELKRGRATAAPDDFGVAEISRRIFDEFYSSII